MESLLMNHCELTPIQVVIADDHPLIRAGVVATLQPHPEFQVVGEVKDGEHLLEMLAEIRCDLLILDLGMEGPPTDRLIQQCQRLQPEVKILILSACLEADFLIPLRGLGISGFVVKEEATDNLLQAVRVVISGSAWFSHTVLHKTMEIAQKERTLPQFMLTPRESEVLLKMKQAKDNQTIANELKVSKQTVRRYATMIYEKLGVKNRVQAIVYCDQ